jgi:serine/threonine protein kinase
MRQDPEYWNRLQALFHVAEATPEAELDSALALHCEDPELRKDARDLIIAARSAPMTTPLSSSMHKRIGPYTVIRHLGSGGIGTVYLVERLVGGTVQRSALKVLSLHAAGPFFADRFTREQHILALLDHPHITRMLDAGLSETGEPYLVMEYVDGVHLDIFCDDRTLSVQDRLKLFSDICEAVAYAHRNLIVHLDLKPSNILVIEGGVPGRPGVVKLLDFGTSKLIQPDASQTTTVMATPAYASPEQLRNDPVTTACDVYALGTILFELLSGRRPNRDASVAVMIERSLKELPPESLPGAVAGPAATLRGLTETRLRSLLAGDLATITAKCLNPRPQDRYTSVDALITDLERYSQGRPIFAHAQTTTYRIGKFVRRNYKSVLAGSFALVALAASLGYAAWRQHQAVVEGRRAIQMQTFLYRLFKLANSNYMGKPAATIPEFLQLGVKVIPAFIKDARDQRAAQLSMAESMFDNGDYFHAEPVFRTVIASAKADGDTGALAEAEGFAGNVYYTLDKPELGKTLATHAYALRNSPGVTPSARIWIQTFYAQNLDETGFRSEENLRILKDSADRSRSEQLPLQEQAYALAAYAEDLQERGQADEAEALQNQVLSIFNKEPYPVCDQALVYRDLLFIHNQRHDFTGGLAMAQKAYDAQKICYGADSLTALSTQGFVASQMLALGRAAEVIPMLEASLPAWRKAVGPDSSHMANPLLFLSRAYVKTGNFTKAQTTAQELVRVLQGKINPHSAEMGVSQMVLAQAFAGQKRYREALFHAQIAADAFSPDAKSPGERDNGARARALLLDMQAKVEAQK